MDRTLHPDNNTNTNDNLVSKDLLQNQNSVCKYTNKVKGYDHDNIDDLNNKDGTTITVEDVTELLELLNVPVDPEIQKKGLEKENIHDNVQFLSSESLSQDKDDNEDDEDLDSIFENSNEEKNIFCEIGENGEILLFDIANSSEFSEELSSFDFSASYSSDESEERSENEKNIKKKRSSNKKKRKRKKKQRQRKYSRKKGRKIKEKDICFCGKEKSQCFSNMKKYVTKQRFLLEKCFNEIKWHPFLTVYPRAITHILEKQISKLCTRYNKDTEILCGKNTQNSEPPRILNPNNRDSISDEIEALFENKEIFMDSVQSNPITKKISSCLDVEKKKRGRPTDYEIEIQWENPKMPKVRLTREEKNMPASFLSDYGDHSLLDPYIHNIINGNKCAFCLKHWEIECQCKCFMGHDRKECGGIPDDQCEPNVISKRHDFGFHATKEMMYGSKMIMKRNTDPLIKKSEFRINRCYRIKYYMHNKKCNLATILIDSLKYHREHRKKKECVRCPICLFTDKSKNAFYSICNGCRNANMVKPYFGVYRGNAGIPVQRRKVVRKTKKNEKLPSLTN